MYKSTHFNSETIENNQFQIENMDIQGYTQRMRLQRRLIGINTVRYLIFMIFTLANHYIRHWMNIVATEELSERVKPLCCQSFRSSLQSHPVGNLVSFILDQWYHCKSDIPLFKLHLHSL